MTKLYVNEIAPRDAAGVHIPGHVIQTIQTQSTTQYINTTTTYGDTPLSATITPRYATSKILVLVSASFFVETVTTSTIECHARITRGGSSIIEFPRVIIIRAAQYSGILGNGSQGILSHIDSPGTTNALTYTLQICSSVTGEGARINKDGIARSTITLMEIAQ